MSRADSDMADGRQGYDGEWAIICPFHALVDESEVRGFSLTVVAVATADAEDIRKQLKQLLRPTQRALHFTKESPESRRAIIGAMRGMTISAKVYHVDARPKVGRSRCLRPLAESLRNSRCRRLVLDQNDSVVKADRQLLREVLGGGWDGTYHHQHDHEEPLLWLADAISWCWNKGGEWARRLDGIDIEVVEVPCD